MFLIRFQCVVQGNQAGNAEPWEKHLAARASRKEDTTTVVKHMSEKCPTHDPTHDLAQILHMTLHMTLHMNVATTLSVEYST